MTLETETADTIPRTACPHLEDLDDSLSGDGDRCQVCGETEDLRVCMTCGHVACCESSEGHDEDHWDETGHPFIRPHAGESYDFLWCYECDAYLT